MLWRREVDEQRQQGEGDQDRDERPGRRAGSRRRRRWLRVFTSCDPGQQLRSSPSAIELRTGCLVSWSAATTTATSATTARRGSRRGAAARGRARVAQPWMMPWTTTLLTISSTMIATIGLKSMPPIGGQHAPEDAQERLADVAQEVEDRVRSCASRAGAAGAEEQLHDDVEEDQQRVDVDQRREVVGDLGACAGEHQAAHAASRRRTGVEGVAERRPQARPARARRRPRRSCRRAR